MKILNKVVTKNLIAGSVCFLLIATQTFAGSQKIECNGTLSDGRKIRVNVSENWAQVYLSKYKVKAIDGRTTVVVDGEFVVNENWPQVGPAVRPRPPTPSPFVLDVDVNDGFSGHNERGERVYLSYLDYRSDEKAAVDGDGAPDYAMVHQIVYCSRVGSSDWSNPNY